MWPVKKSSVFKLVWKKFQNYVDPNPCNQWWVHHGIWLIEHLPKFVRVGNNQNECVILMTNHSHRMTLCPNENEYILLTYWKIWYRISLKTDTWDTQDSLAQITLRLDIRLYHLKQLVEFAQRVTSWPTYCRFGTFRENFIFGNSIKRHISGVKNSGLRQDLPISKNNRVILPFREGFIFTKLRICEVYAKFRENKVLAKNSQFTVLVGALIPK